MELIPTNQNNQTVSVFGVSVVGDHFFVGRRTDGAAGMEPRAPPLGPSRFSVPAALSPKSETPS